MVSEQQKRCGVMGRRFGVMRVMQVQKEVNKTMHEAHGATTKLLDSARARSRCPK
jgi:hypothetical protein